MSGSDYAEENFLPALLNASRSSDGRTPSMRSATVFLPSLRPPAIVAGHGGLSAELWSPV